MGALRQFDWTRTWGAPLSFLLGRLYIFEIDCYNEMTILACDIVDLNNCNSWCRVVTAPMFALRLPFRYLGFQRKRETWIGPCGKSTVPLPLHFTLCYWVLVWLLFYTDTSKNWIYHDCRTTTHNHILKNLCCNPATVGFLVTATW